MAYCVVGMLDMITINIVPIVWTEKNEMKKFSFPWQDGIFNMAVFLEHSVRYYIFSIAFVDVFLQILFLQFFLDILDFLPSISCLIWNKK